jgi:hypothetical protein
VTARSGNETRIRVEILIRSDVDDIRSAGRSDKAGELGNCDFCGRRHDASFLEQGLQDAKLGLSPHGAFANPMAGIKPRKLAVVNLPGRRVQIFEAPGKPGIRRAFLD